MIVRIGGGIGLVSRDIEGGKSNIRYTFFGGDKHLPCNEKSYGEKSCPKCGEMAYSHRYDAAHIPWLVYGYQYHCHSCSCRFEETSVLENQKAYLEHIRGKNTKWWYTQRGRSNI
jgi:hypothetical protein